MSDKGSLDRNATVEPLNSGNVTEMLRHLCYLLIQLRIERQVEKCEK